MAYEPLDRIIGILARKLEKEMRVPRATALVASRTLILALFRFKIARPLLTPSDGERDAVDKTIELWLSGLSPGTPKQRNIRLLFPAAPGFEAAR